MAETVFNPGKILGDKIKEKNREELCELVSKLCVFIQNEVGTGGCRGGIYPENISLDDEGNVALGPAAESGWEGQELEFLAPELYWNSSKGPVSDVYSLGLLLYYAVSGKLPFAGSEDAQQKRMGGEDILPPETSGRRLGEIIEKAVRFKASERYQTVEELKIVLDNCEKNTYIDEETGSAAIFNKNNEELSDIERLMVDIIDGEAKNEAAAAEEVTQPEETEAVCEETAEEEPAEEEPAEEEPAEEEPVAEENTEPAAEEEAEEEASEEEEIPEEVPEEAAEEEPEEEAKPEIKSDEESMDEALAAVMAAAAALAEAAEKSAEKRAAVEAEEVKVYRPASEHKEPIPILTEDKNPELQPVILNKTPIIMPAVQYSKTIERERKIAEEVKKRKRRPVAIVLSLSAILVIAAIIVNAMLNDFDEKNKPAVTLPESTNIIVEQPNKETGNSSFTGTVVVPTPGVTSEIQATVEPEETPEVKEEATEKRSRYEVFVENVSWTEARDNCLEMGGHLAVISDEEEFNAVVELVHAAGIDKAWLGCHRVDGTLVWESTDPVDFYRWDGGGPSYWDSWDGVAEDYLLLWYNDGWSYNDSRNDPVADYPQWYSGTIGYVCEFYE